MLKLSMQVELSADLIMNLGVFNDGESTGEVYMP